MPDFDAGTARAHIKVDGDSRGADKATRSVEGFQKALEFIANHLGGFVAAMSKIEAELNDVQGDFKDAASAADKYDDALAKANISTVKTSKSTKEFARNIDDLHGKLKFAHDAMAEFVLPTIQAAKAFQEFNRQGGGIKGVIAGISRAGIAGTAINALKNHFIGFGAALRQAPAWQQSIARLAQNVGLVTLAGSRLSLVVPLLERGFARLVRGAEGADFAMAGFARTIGGLSRVTGGLGGFFATLDKIPTSMFKVVGGMALMSSGIRGLQTRFAAINTILGSGGGGLGKALRFVLLPGIILSSAATQAFDKTLVFLSNTIAGLWSGIKQLAGGFAALPGAIAIVGAAALPLVVIAKTIKSNFKDLFAAVNANDADKFAEAMRKIPPYLRPLAQVAANAIGPLKSLGDVLTATFVGNGLANQIQTLVNTWLPAISIGADQVANSWKILTNNVLQFLGEAKTVSGVNTIFMHTSETMNAIGTAIQPVLDGLRDLAVVGSGFLRILAEDYLPSIGKKFGDWASNAAATGKAMGWMEGSVAAVKNLYTGFDQLVRLTYTLLTLFQTKPGDTFLGSFAAEMTKLNKQVQASAVSGELRKIADAVKGIGSDKIHELWQMFKDALPTIKAVLQTLSQMGSAFSQILLPTIQAVIAVLAPMIQLFNALGGGTILGTILGLSKAFGIVKFALGTALDSAKLFIGALSIKSGIATAFGALGQTLEKFGPIGQRAAQGVYSIGTALQAVSGILTGVAISAAAFWLVWTQGSQQVNDANKAIADSTSHITDQVEKVRTAFQADKGTVGNNVISALTQNVEQSMNDLQNVSDKAPGIMAHLKDFADRHGAFGDLSHIFDTGESDSLNQLQDRTASAGKALAALKQQMDASKFSSADLANVISGSAQTYDDFKGKLLGIKDGGDLAATKLQEMRDRFLDLQKDAQNAGAGMLELQAGIQKIAGAGGDATTKLDGLKMALQGLGLLKQDAYEAAFAYAKAIDDLGDAAAKAADPSQGFSDILDAQTELFNTNSVNARNLYNVLQPLAESYLHAVATGKDANELWNQQQDQLQKVADSFHLTKDEVVKLVQSLGEVPQVVGILVQLSGKDKFAQELGQVVATAQTHLNNTQPIEVPIGIDAKKVADDLNRTLRNPNAVGVDGGNIVLGVGIDQNAISALLRDLATRYGIKTVDGPPVAPGAAATMPVMPTAPAPGPVIPAPGEQPAPPKSESKSSAAAPSGPPPSGYQLPVGLPPPAGYVPPATKNSRGIPQPATPPPGLPPGTYYPPGMTPPGQAPPVTPQPPVPVGTPAPPLPALSNTLAPAGAGQGQGVNIPVQITGIDQFGALQDQFKALGVSLAKNVGEWLAWNAGINGALQGVLSSVQSVMAAVVQNATDSGKSFSAGFAAGITDPASLQKIAQAAALAAKTAADYMPHSPARKGPLSGQGWSGVAGGAFSGDFATGILGGAAGVGDAAGKVAGKARGALTPKTPYGKFGFDFKGDGLGQINQILKAAADGISLFKSISGQVTDVAKLFMPKQTGTGGKNGAGVIGGILNQGASGLAGIKSPSKDDIASAIAGEAAKQGYDRNTAIAVISAAMQESGIDPNVTNASGHHGLFQQSSDKPSQADASQQIQWMFSQLGALGGPSNPNLKSDPLDLIASQIEKGSYGGAALGQHSQAAASLYDKVLQTGALGGAGGYALPGLGALSNNPASAASRLPKADNIEDSIKAAGGLPSLYPTSGPGAYQLPPWMQQLASAFGLTASTYSSGGSLHQMGFAADFNDPNAPGGNSPKLDAFAQYLSSNLSGQTLQLIHQGMNGQAYAIAGGQRVGPGTNQPGYFAGDLGGHQDHVHWATDVAPILANANAGALPFAAGNLPAQQSGYGTQNPIAPGQNNQALGPSNASPAAAGLGNAGDQVIDANGNPITAGNTAVTQGQQAGAVSDANQAGQVFNAVSGAASGIAGIASDVVGTIQAGVDAWGATKYIADQAVRGISDTEDVFKLVDQVQKYVTFAAKIASTTGDVLSTVSSLIPSTGGADFGGAEGAKEGLEIASQVAQMISAALTTVNAVIDFGQEAYRIWGSYFGQFLGFLTGGAGGMMGDVHFLLDQNTNQLLAYSSDNPLDKTAHTLPGQTPNANANNQLIGQLNYYAGPGEDPRVGTRNMMYQVRASTLSTVTAQ